jgi:hypothetical protein
MAESWLAWLRASCSYGSDTKKEIVLVPVLAHIPDPFSPSVLGPHRHGSPGMCRKGKPSFPLPDLCSHRTCKHRTTQPRPHTHTGGPEGGFSPPSPSYSPAPTYAQMGHENVGQGRVTWGPPFLLHPPCPCTDRGLCSRVFPLPPSYAPTPTHAQGNAQGTPCLFSPSHFYSRSTFSLCLGKQGGRVLSTPSPLPAATAASSLPAPG